MGGLKGTRLLIAVSVLSLTGCVQRADTYLRPRTALPASAPPTATATQSQTIDLEASDRIARFRRLASMMGTAAPQVEELYAAPGTVPGVSVPVPVVRVVFPERVLFDFDQSTPRPEAMAIVDMVAENMKRDVPDAALTILGHTDAVGSDAYNIALSQRRASTVLSDLIQRGLNPNQLSTVAIGKAQPIAPNSTEEGRARNRRVEFLISGSEQANLSVVQNRPINASYLVLRPNEHAPDAPIKTAQVLKPVRSPVRENDEGILGPAGILTLRTVESGSLPATPVSETRVLPHAPAIPIVPSKPSSPAAVIPRTPEPVLPAFLKDPSPPNF